MVCLFDRGWYPGLMLQDQCAQLNLKARAIKGEVYAYEKEVEIQLDHIESILPTPKGECLKKYIELLLNGQWLNALEYEIMPEFCKKMLLIDANDWADWYANTRAKS